MLDGSRAALAQSADQPTCRPRESRAGEIGCWIIVDDPVGTLPSEAVFWHLDTYPSQALADAANAGGGTVVESLGKFWLFTIAGHNWRPDLWRPCRRRRSAAGSPRRRVFGDVYGGHLHSRHDVKQTYTLWSGGLVHARRRDMPGDARRHHGRTGRRPPGHCPGWTADAFDGHRDRRTSGYRPDSS